MKAILFYFSGTGNTWWASSELKKELERLGGTVEMYSLENPALKEEGFVDKKVKEADHVIVGYPVYGSDMPRNMKELLCALPCVTGKKAFSAFCTQADFSGDGCVFFKKEIEGKGYRFLQAFQVNMTTNFNVAMPLFSLFKPAEGAKLEKIKAKAAEKIKRMAAAIIGGKVHIEGTRFYLVLPGRLQRSFFRRSEKDLAGSFRFLKERCTRCGLCVRTCPTENIVLEPDGIRRKDNCLLCFRCYNLCPALAINYGGEVKDPEKYKRYKGPVEHLDISEIRK